MRKIANDGSAPNPCALQIGDSLKYQREKLKLDKFTISITANITLETLEMLEAGKRLPIKDYENVAIVLGLDERYLGIKHPCPEKYIDTNIRYNIIHTRYEWNDKRYIGETDVSLMYNGEEAWIWKNELTTKDEEGKGIFPRNKRREIMRLCYCKVMISEGNIVIHGLEWEPKKGGYFPSQVNLKYSKIIEK